MKPLKKKNTFIEKPPLAVLNASVEKYFIFLNIVQGTTASRMIRTVGLKTC